MATVNQSRTYADIELPTKQQMKRLPTRAMLSFALRCVQRVRRFYDSRHPQCGTALDRVLEEVSKVCQGKRPQMANAEIQFALKHAQHQGARFVAQAVNYLAHAAMYVDRNRDSEDCHLATYKAWLAIAAAYNADADLSFIFAARDDFDYLVVICDAPEVPGTPVQGDEIDPSESGELGPLWSGAL